MAFFGVFPPLSFFPATMFAARVRASLKPLLDGRLSSSLSRKCEIVVSSRRVLLDRFNDGDRTLTSLRVTGNGVRTKLFHRGFQSSSTNCYSSESDVGVKAQTTMDDLFSELGSIQKDGYHNVVMELLTNKPKPEKTKGKKKTNKNKTKQEQVSGSVSKLKLLTEKPDASWKSNGKSKRETHASLPARIVTDSSSPIPDTESKAQSIVSPSSEAKNKTSSNGSSTSVTPSSVVVIRISKLNSETTHSEIHSRCLSIGSLQGLSRVSEDSVDVLFRARNMKEADSILNKLNEATVDHSQWTAEVVPEASKDQMGMRITSSFEDMKKQLMMRQILVKDLEVLVHSLVHLENHPMSREGY